MMMMMMTIFFGNVLDSQSLDWH